jgi:hypothetical protein
MVLALEHFLYFVGVELAAFLIVLVRVIICDEYGFVFPGVGGGVFPELPEGGVELAAVVLVVAELVDFVLELLYFGEVVVFADGFALQLLAAHLEV